MLPGARFHAPPSAIRARPRLTTRPFVPPILPCPFLTPSASCVRAPLCHRLRAPLLSPACLTASSPPASIMARPAKTAAKSEPVSKKRSSSSGGASKRPPSAYNLFMKAELPKFKEANPGVSHKDAFKKVAESWKTHPSNPKKI